MATKSKSDFALVWSVLALLLAAMSLGYCASLFTNWLESSIDWPNRTITMITRMLKGGV